MKRQLDELLEDTQHLLRESERVRDAFFWKKLDLKSVAGFEASTAPLREVFHKDVIGRLELPSVPSNARSRLIYDEPKYLGYEVVLDVAPPEVFAYGILLLPKDLKPGERRPVVVCQHGLEGRPQDLADPKKSHPAYNQYANRLAERGFGVFAPQTPISGRTSSASSSARPTCSACTSSRSSSSSTASSPTGWRRSRSSTPTASPSTASRTAARRRCACRRS
jgi:hypothetical protein